MALASQFGIKKKCRLKSGAIPTLFNRPTIKIINLSYLVANYTKKFYFSKLHHSSSKVRQNVWFCPSAAVGCSFSDMKKIKD